MGELTVNIEFIFEQSGNGVGEECARCGDIIYLAGVEGVVLIAGKRHPIDLFVCQSCAQEIQ